MPRPIYRIQITLSHIISADEKINRTDTPLNLEIGSYTTCSKAEKASLDAYLETYADAFQLKPQKMIRGKGAAGSDWVIFFKLATGELHPNWRCLHSHAVLSIPANNALDDILSKASFFVFHSPHVQKPITNRSPNTPLLFKPDTKNSTKEENTSAHTP